MSEKLMPVHIDFLAGQPKTDQSREEIGTLLKGRFDRLLPSAVDRYLDLPKIAVMNPSDEYCALLLEARDLFVAGHFYSCVAMCGIVAERLVKDVFRKSVLIRKNGNIERPTEVVFDQMERVEAIRFTDFLAKAGLLEAAAVEAVRKLAELRNKYAHARGKNPQADAADAIKMLHTLVDGTVSVFKDFEIKEGRFVPKAPPRVAGP